MRLAIKPPDKDHPYGHGKADPIAAAVVGVAMIAAAIGIAAESINLIRTPHKLPHAYTLWVLLCVFPVKALLSRYVAGVSEKIESAALRGDAWHHLSDAITSGLPLSESPPRCGRVIRLRMTGQPCAPLR